MTTETTDLHISDFDFDLPEAHIAKRPPEHREDARLLDVVTQQGTQPGKTEFHDRTIKELPTLVQPGDIWVINDAKVIPARLFGQKITGGQIEILLLEPAGEDHQWFAWGKSNKPLKAGTQIHFSEHFSAEVLSREGKTLRLKLIADDVGQAIESHGHMPLPPYIDRPDSEADQQRYQTVFAEHKGAVAAPTAGLHLTPALMQSMEQAGARFVRVTLHVGPGTFQPVQVDHVRDHQMHEEAYIISEAAAVTINQAKAAGQRIVAVGTTSLRTLEAASQAGNIRAGAGRTDIFIYPGYQFQMADALLTNFHLPRSTLLMLVSALAGKEPVMQAYQHAIEQNYRFYSYGDAMFLRRTSFITPNLPL